MRDGFTLLELLIALAVMSVLAAVAIPAFAAPTNATDLIVSSLNQARSTAFNRAAVVTVDVTAHGHIVVVACETDNACSTLEDTQIPAADSIVRKARWTIHPTGLANVDTAVIRTGSRYTAVSLDPWTTTVLTRGD